MSNKLNEIRKLWKSFAAGRFDKHIANVNFISADDNGRCVAELKLDESHTNQNGALHGGCTATLIDSISGMVFLLHKNLNDSKWQVSTDIHVRYLTAAKLGDTVVIKTDTRRAEKNLGFLEITLTNKQTGETIAMGSQTKYIIQED